MNVEDLRAFSELGSAFWADTEYSQEIISEALSVATLLGLPPEKTLERACAVVLDRAEREGIAVNIKAIQQPFFRLLPKERFILSALHLGRWSYARVGRILGQSPEDVAMSAWNVRINLAAGLGAYPTGSKNHGMRCPVYNPKLPWTQRFLDEEMTPQEKVFIQNHLIACDRCREALLSCKQVYYTVSSMIPRCKEGIAANQLANQLEETWKEAQALIHPMRRTLRESVRIFLRRKEVRWVLWIAAAGVVWRAVS